MNNIPKQILNIRSSYALITEVKMSIQVDLDVCACVGDEMELEVGAEQNFDCLYSEALKCIFFPDS